MIVAYISVLCFGLTLRAGIKRGIITDKKAEEEGV
jgi:hypothetical protein